jgi:hypothetical protein
LNSSLVGFGDSVLFGISEDYVHVLVEGQECADHHASILNGDSHSEINPLKKFTSLRGHLYKFIIDFDLKLK